MKIFRALYSKISNTLFKRKMSKIYTTLDSHTEFGWDVALAPRTDGHTDNIMETKEWVWNNGILVEQDVEAWKQELIKTKRIELAEKKASIFKDFLSKL